MDPEKRTEARLEARNAVDQVFEKRRAALSGRDPLMRQFLAELNGAAADMEREAVDLADAGREWKHVLEKSEERIKGLKEDFLKRLGKGEPAMEAANRDLIREVEEL
jgi:hypothetical protein